MTEYSRISALKILNEDSMDDNEARDNFYERTNQRVEEFVHEIPFDELFDYIKKITNINDLQFNVEYKKTRAGEVYPTFESQNIADRLGFLSLIFKEATIGSFSSGVSVHKPQSYKDIDYSIDYPLSYYCSVTLNYELMSYGRNGCNFLKAYYEDGQWQFILEADTRRKRDEDERW